MTRDGRQNDTPPLTGKNISLQVLILTCFAPRRTTFSIDVNMMPFMPTKIQQKAWTTHVISAQNVSRTVSTIQTFVKCAPNDYKTLKEMVLVLEKVVTFG